MIFYKVLTSNGICQNFSPIRLLVYKLRLFKWRYCCKFSKQWKNLNFMCWWNIAFWWEKILFKQSNDLISVIQILLRWKQQLRGGMLILNAVVQTQITVNTSKQKSSKATKDANISWQGFGLHILRCTRYHRLPLKRKTHQLKYFIALLVHLKEEIAKKWPQIKKKKVLFHQDNAPCHKSITTMAKLHELHLELLPHSSYSPDIAPIDYWLLADPKRMFQRKRFDYNEEVILETEMYFEAKNKLFYKKGIKLLVSF